ncbi:LuxR C-terminal-related transcriptional regulator [Aeromonas veronii]
MGIALRTITFHLERIADKLGVGSKSHAISWALKQGLVRLNIVRQKQKMSASPVNHAEWRNMLRGL